MIWWEPGEDYTNYNAKHPRKTTAFKLGEKCNEDWNWKSKQGTETTFERYWWYMQSSWCIKC